MKAAVLKQLNAPLEIEELYVPALGVGQVLVRVLYAGICGAQIGMIDGAKGPDKRLPHLLGHEGGGIVLKIGPGVKTVHEGDHVVMHWRKGAGIDAGFAVYRRISDHAEISGGPVHTFCEQAVVSENRLTRIDTSIPLELAALLGCAVTTGLGIALREARLRAGQSIAVFGCGGVGHMVIHGAALCGAHPIVGIDLNWDKLHLAKRFGATHIFHADDVADADEFDVVVDCTGLPEVIDKALRMTAPGGILILVGQPRVGQDVIITNMRQHYIGKVIMDSQGGGTIPQLDIPRYERLYLAGKLNIKPLITNYCELDTLNEAIALIRAGKEPGRCILRMLP